MSVVARATAGKVLASRCARWGQSTRRGISSPPMKSEAPRPPGLPFELPGQAPPPAVKEGTSQVLLGRAGLEQRGWPAPTRHTRLTVTEGLRRARARLRQPAHRPWLPSSRRWGPVIPGARPRSWPSAASDSGELQQAGRRDTTRSFGMSSKVCVGWAASAVTPGRQSLNGRAADGHVRASG